MTIQELHKATLTAELQASITPEMAKELLKLGNQLFVDEKLLGRELIAQVKQTTSGQFPHSVILSCIDSRIPTEIVFNQGVGDVFNARVAGNIVNADILGSIEYGCKVAGSKLVVVMGHTGCGAVKGACDHVELGNITHLLDNIMPAVNAVETPEGVERNSKNAAFVNAVSKRNVELTIKKLRRNSPVLSEMEENGEIDIVGAMYDIGTGKVTFYD
ncbi:MAG: carbonic anhydrase family protein [Bacteroidota bacterium]